MDEAAMARARRVVLFTAFLDILGFGIIIPQLGIFASNFGATPQEATFLASTYSAMGFIFTPIWGRLSDRIGRRPVLLISIFGTACSLLMFGLAHSLAMLFAARLIDGVTAGNISTAQAYLTDITKPQDRAKIFGMFGAIFGVGFAFGPMIGALISHIHGPWGGNLGLGVFAAALSFTNWAMAMRSLPETLSPAIRAENQKRHEETKSSWFNVSGFKKALAIPGLNAVIVIGFLATTAFATMQGTYSLFVITKFSRPLAQEMIRTEPAKAALQAKTEIESGSVTKPVTASAEGGDAVDSGGESAPYPPAMGGDFTLNQPILYGLPWRRVEKLLVRPLAGRAVGGLFTVIGLLSLVVQGGLIRPLKKKMSELHMVLAGTFIMAMGLAFIPFPTEFWGEYVAAALLTLGNGLSTPVLSALVSQLAPERDRGEIIGVYQSIGSLGRIIGPTTAGFFFQRISPGAPFWVGGLIMLCSFALAFNLRGTVAEKMEPQAAA